MSRVQLYKVRRTFKDGRYEWLNVTNRGRFSWVPLEIDGTAFDENEAVFWRAGLRASNKNADVIFHAVVPV